MVDEHLKPAVANGECVILDRFWYSTIAYQAYGLGLDEDQVRAAINLAIGDVVVDCAFLLRVDPAQAAARRADQADDRIEARGLAYLQRVADGYEAQIARGDLTALDGTLPVADIAAHIWTTVEPLVTAKE